MKERLLSLAVFWEVIRTIRTALADGMAGFLPTPEMMVTMTLFTSAISNVSKSRGLILMTPLTGVVMESLTLMGVRVQISSGMLTLVVRPQV